LAHRRGLTAKCKRNFKFNKLFDAARGAERFLNKLRPLFTKFTAKFSFFGRMRLICLALAKRGKLVKTRQSIAANAYKN
jgi:hypothetical protein